MRTSVLPLFTRRAKNYVNNSEAGYIAVFDVKPDGTVTNQRVFAEVKDDSQSGVPEGFKVDLEGNIYSTEPGECGFYRHLANFWGRFLCLRRRLIWLGEIEITKCFILPEVKVFIEFALKTVCSEDFSPSF